jgi:hypothetical protein
MKKKNLPVILVMILSIGIIIAILIHESVLMKSISSDLRQLIFQVVAITYILTIMSYIVYVRITERIKWNYIQRKINIQKKRDAVYFNQCVDHILKNEDALFEFKYNLIKNENQKMNLYHL